VTAVTGAPEAEVLVRRQNGLGRITLNRPRAINALSHAMVNTIAGALAEWAADDSIGAVVLDGAGDRGLCAGGDIRAIYLDAVAGGTATIDFWFDEYRLNSQIARYPKPFVAIMDGLVMGGGIGLSAHASHRVVTERSKVGMPEVKIGMVPDVGGTFLLSRAPGNLGLHAALTGATLTGDDAIALGLADRLVRHARLAGFVARIADAGPDVALAEFAEDGSASDIVARRAWIDRCYEAATVQEVLRNLQDEPDPDAQAAAVAIAAASPLALAVTFRAIRSAAFSTLEQALNQEYRIACFLFRSADLAEGIRAQVIDKDRHPRWNPNSLADLTDQVIDKAFAATPTVPFDDADTAPERAEVAAAAGGRP
jgi:enoyl-CoA hydratase